jgi:hypothetical protein
MPQRIEPPPICANFEHEIGSGGGSGDSGGSLRTKRRGKLSYFLNSKNLN